MRWRIASISCDLGLAEAPLQEPLLGLAGGSQLERCQVGTPRLVAAAEAAQEVSTSRWQQVVAGQGGCIQCVKRRQAGLVAVAEPTAMARFKAITGDGWAASRAS